MGLYLLRFSMDETESELTISNDLHASHLLIEELEYAVGNGQCSEALLYIAHNPSGAPYDFIDILLRVNENIESYPEEERPEIRKNLKLAASFLAKHIDDK